MADLLVTLPESQPGDDEDVVWALSTASALWARGERRDALVWLRRAVDAAESVGDTFRASALGIAVQEVEEAFLADQASDMQGKSLAIEAPPRPPLASIDVEIDVEPELQGFTPSAAPSPERTLPIAAPGVSAETAPNTGASALQLPPYMSTSPSEPAATATPVPPKRPSFAPPAMSASPPHAAVPSAPSRPAPPPLRPTAAAIPPASPSLQQSPVGTTVPQPAAIPSSTPRSPSSIPPPQAPAVLARAPVSASSSAGRRKVPPRAPILDPWSEDTSHPAPHAASPGSPIARRRITLVDADERTAGSFIAARPHANVLLEDDDEVITSAAPIAKTLQRKPHPPPLPSVPTASTPAGAPPQTPAMSPRPPAAVMPEHAPGGPSSASVAVAQPSDPTAQPQGSSPHASIALSASKLVPVTGAAPLGASAEATPLPPPPAVPAPAALSTQPAISQATPPESTATTSSVGPHPPIAAAVNSTASSTPGAARPSAAPRAKIASIGVPVPTKLPRPGSSTPPAASTPKPGSMLSASQPPAVLPAPPISSSTAPTRRTSSVTGSKSAHEADAAKSMTGSQGAISSRSALDDWPIPEDAPPRKGVDKNVLEDVETLADLPEDVLESLAAMARLEALRTEEELCGFGVAVVLAGEVFICSSTVDVAIQRVGPQGLIPARGSFAESTPLRIIAGPDGAKVALWDPAAFDTTLRSCPWVLDEQRLIADRFHALAGATLGHLGELDDTSRQLVFDKFVLQVLAPNEVFPARGSKLPGIVVVGTGIVEVMSDDPQYGTVKASPGMPLFADAAQRGHPVSFTCRALEGGAILLVLPIAALEELFGKIPALPALLAG